MNTKKHKHTDIEYDQLADRVLIQRSHLFRQNDEKEIIALHYRDYKQDEIGQLHRFARSFTQRPLSIDAEARGNKQGPLRIKLDQNCKDLIFYLSLNFKAIREAYPLYKQSPIFDVFEATQSKFPRMHIGAYQGIQNAISAHNLLRQLNVACRYLYRRLRSTSVKEAYSNFRRGPQKAYRHLLEYLDFCFKQRTNLLAIRIDLNIGLTDTQILNPEHQIDFEQMKKWRDQFKSHLDSVFGENRIGYVIKMEHGATRQLHLHCLLLLDAAKHQQDISIGKQLGEHWKKNITNGLGDYFNVNASRRRHLWPAIGKVDGTNPTVQMGMQFIAAYFTLGELFVKPIFCGKKPTLTSGTIQTQALTSRGRRQKYVGGITGIPMSQAIRQIKFI